MATRRAVSAAIAITALTAGATAQEGAPGTCIHEAGQAVAVAEVIDGDTLRLVEGTLVRLAGVTTPRGPMAADETLPLQETARRVLSALLATGAVTMLTTDEVADRYGRIHGQVFVEQPEGTLSWVQERLAERGLVRVERPRLTPACNKRLRDAEATAIAAQTGLWGEVAHGIWDARDPSLTSRIGLYEVVEGLVLSVGTRTYMTFVDFGREYRRDFTVMITPSMVEKLAVAGMVVADIAGRRVRVRGVIEMSGWPAIRLKQVDEIAILGDE